MIRITDMTLSCIEAYHPSALQLETLFMLLQTVGLDTIEMPVSVYDILKPVPADKLALRIASPGDAEAYPEISRFICRKNGFAASPAVTQELQMNDVKEIGLGRNREAASVRIVGLDDIFSHDYGAVFSNMRKHFGSRAEFCPENGYSCATAAAVEWVISGGTDLAASFGGIGGKAALEEVLLSLRIVRRYKPSASFDFFPQIAALLEDIVGAYFSDRKAVIGRKIFHVESGIHVDGILKKPQMYEPYLPELVGCSRRFVI
jgi:homocitrate synthase NifV